MNIDDTLITIEKVVRRRSKGEDYVNNAEFSSAVTDYVNAVKKNVADGKEPMMVPNYIAECFIKICNGLARAPSFMSYTFREDMVMDAVENCLKAIHNYDADKPTRTGTPNPFSYFTQISYFAFLRRIAKEKKQTTIKNALSEHACIDTFADFNEYSESANMIGESMVERIRQKNDTFYKVENELAPIFEISKKSKTARNRSVKKEGPLDILFEDV